MVEELPKSLQKRFEHPKEDWSVDRISIEKEVRLDGIDVSLFLKSYYSVAEDADEDGSYSVETKTIEYWFSAEPWGEDGNADGGDLREYKRLLHTWIEKVKTDHPKVATELGL